MNSCVLGFQDIDRASDVEVGGKGANLGELSKIAGIHVPEGFCVSTEAFRSVVLGSSPIGEMIDQLSLLVKEEREKLGELIDEIRKAIEEMVIPEDIVDDVSRHLAEIGASEAYAVRSSATAEDSPMASFAGQHETYLNVVGKDEILKHLTKCWASLYTERAVIYRNQNGFDHRKVRMSVVVQKMVFPQAAGILFTADPVTSNRKVTTIDAGFGLGEALVSGLSNADVYTVREGKILEKKVASNPQVLSDEQILRLERQGRRIEAHFGCPQDIEWCWVDDTFYVVQSRPITTLFPIPEAGDRENHVYLSVGHQQMMTDAMKPLGLSLFQLTAARPMSKAGGRLFVDVTPNLVSPATRAFLVEGMGKHDPLIKDALMAIIDRSDFISVLPDENGEASARIAKGKSSSEIEAQVEGDPAIVTELIKQAQESIAELKRNIRTKSGSELFDFILEDISQLKKMMFNPRSSSVFMSAMEAANWVNEHMKEWLGEKSVADTLSQSVPNNITSEMGLALLNVADVIRPYPDLIDYLQATTDENFLDELEKFDGGKDARNAIQDYLDQYGMRCVGEIDLTKARWSERPLMLVPLILSNIRNFEPGAGSRRFEQGRLEALNKEQELLVRLKDLPEADEKIDQTKRMIALIRNFIGYREYPKYGMISRFFVYKQALLQEAKHLVQAGVIQEIEDIYYLTLQELREVVRTKDLDEKIIMQRREEHAAFERLTPPRVMTSDGEILFGAYKRDGLPADALAGLAVSSGLIEGRARVLLKMEDANLEAGDILVTAFTDPSWTPLFVSIKGLVTEVGGLMTHGAVIAREYGLPAVVGVLNATKLIKDGQRIRVHGTEGYVQIL